MTKLQTFIYFFASRDVQPCEMLCGMNPQRPLLRILILQILLGASARFRQLEGRAVESQAHRGRIMQPARPDVCEKFHSPSAKMRDWVTER